MVNEALLADPAKLAAALRDELDVSISYASELANGKRKPSLSLAVRIEDKLGIPPSAWLQHGEGQA